MSRTTDNSIGLAGFRVLRDSRNKDLLDAICSNASGGDLYFMVFDSQSQPGEGDYPLAFQKVPSGECRSITFYQGRRFTAGICLALSSTMPTYTAAGETTGIFDAVYTC